MAEELRTREGNKLVRQTVYELEEKQKKEALEVINKKPKKTSVFPAVLVEGMYAHCLQQLVHQMNSLFLIFNDPETSAKGSFDTQEKKVKAVKAVHQIFLQEIDTVRHCLIPYHDASLKPKHRLVKRIINEAYERFSNLSKTIATAKYMNHSAITKFGKEMIQFVTNFHITLHEETTKKERSKIVKEYCNEEV